MKAFLWHKYGSPEKLQLADIDKPSPKFKEILVKVYATTVNRTDCAMLRARPFAMRFMTGLIYPRIKVLGTEFAGEVVGTGNNVSVNKVGDRVFAFDGSGLKTYMEYLTVSEDKVITIPDNISYEHAAASIEGAHYAINMINKVKLDENSKVIVNGATGGIGSACIQILRHYNITVVGIGNTKNIELVKSLGVERVINYEKEDFTKDREKYDVVFDTVGKSTFSKCKHILNPGGVYISSELGPFGQNLFYPIITKFSGNKGRKVVFPLPLNIMKSMRLIKEMLISGDFKPVVDRYYPFEQIKEAFKYVETGQKTGNVVITMNHED